MVHFNKKIFAGYVILYVTLVVLMLMYISRVSMYEWNWAYSLLLVYGVVVTPFLIFRFAITYSYQSVPDRGFRPKISVIVPVYNEENGIADTIDSILDSDYPKDKLELVVIDDKSKDHSLEVINKKRLERDFKLVKNEKNMGKRHAMATGIKQCSGDILVCIDSDTFVKPDAIKLLVQPFTDPEVYCVCGNGVVANESEPKINNLLTRLQKVWYADSFRIRKGVESIFGIVICCSGVLSAYRKEKFEKVVNNWLNEKFLGHDVVSGDDRQMTNLMMQMGGKSVFQSNALAYTFAPHKFKKFLIQQLRWGRSAFRGMLFASKFFTKKNTSQKLVFYTTMFVNFVSPISLLMNTVVLALLGQYWLVGVYLLGLLLLSTLFAFNDKLLVDYFSFKDVGYRIIFFALSIAITFVYLYSWVTPWKGKVWGTR
jgi:hyaluronan synthase